MTEPIVVSVIEGSIAKNMGIEKGDSIISINDEKIGDILDYRFFSADPFLSVKVRKESGKIVSYEAENYESQDLGLEISFGDEAKARHCKNKCIFCFIDQNPKGMRDTIYFKDDDVRLSFLTGSYITLTNLTETDIARIMYQHISPINVSVHTTDSSLRVKMLKNKDAGKVYKLMKKLSKNGITMNCQIVLCKGINDGKNLNKTVKDLLKLYPFVNSVSVVPVGLTKFREGLENLVPFDSEDSKKVIEQLVFWQNKAKKKYDVNFVYASDEFYLKAGLPLPQASHYDGYPQIENGVGMITSFREEFAYSMETLPETIGNRDVGIITGRAAEALMNEVSRKLTEKYSNLKLEVFPIDNDFFGRSVTVSGLITGKDIIAQLKDKALPKVLLMPDVMFKDGSETMLDDLTKEELEFIIKAKIKIIPSVGDVVAKEILGI
ncbi:MAG: DUF512 domain-containing protein [Bacillota bacterium]|nr:DUF512 domain-containing protein [Bacillota bacterium]